MHPAYHTREGLSMDERKLPLIFVHIVKVRCDSPLGSPAALRPDIRPRHRLAFVHGNAEVVFPQTGYGYRGKLPERKQPAGKFFPARLQEKWTYVIVFMSRLPSSNTGRGEAALYFFGVRRFLFTFCRGCRTSSGRRAERLPLW